MTASPDSLVLCDDELQSSVAHVVAKGERCRNGGEGVEHLLIAAQ